MQATGSLYLFNIRPCVHNTAFIAKYGFTKDLARRTKEHARLYRPDPIFLVCQARVSVGLLREAEEQLRYELKSLHIGPQAFGLYEIPRGREIVQVAYTDLEWINEIYKRIEYEYRI